MSSRRIRSVVFGATAAFCFLSCAAGVMGSDQLRTFRGSEPSLRSFTSSFRLMHTLPGKSEGMEQLIIADPYGYVNILAPSDKGFKRVWKSFHLGAPVINMFIHDLGQDGNLKLIVHTKDRLFLFDATSHELLWESVEANFTGISAMAVGQFDSSDPQHEFLILAESTLYIYDGVRFNREWVGTQPFEAQEMVVGNVDGDEEEEVVFNTGYVFGALSHSIKWQTENFGTHLGLIDVDGDGILEVIGESTGGKLYIFDIDKRQEKQNL